ncbi:hypothetical protein HMPREF9952_0099 [Haemophilus pittmaniae HK 85]|uniref:Uncharacterized protein n=1 Tax=Haemophilus pittmaniae HK 85 TaxID=1035188 RepID=F9Q891_9PAST|nr:hypothetical protein HMPREF9952_0099 [Haemophilus pittmaniae HK 85]
MIYADTHILSLVKGNKILPHFARFKNNCYSAQGNNQVS